MTVIVTGHMGFVGTHLMRALADLGEEAAGMDIREGSNILNCPLPPAERVYHLAAITDAQSGDADSIAYVNIVGTVRLLQRYGSKVVLASSSMVNYPENPYALSKRAAEEFATLYGAAIVRFPNLYGDGGHSAIDKFRDAKIVEVRGSGEQRRTYAHVDDAVLALLNAKPGEIEIVPGVNHTVNELAALEGKPIRRVPQTSRWDIVEGVQI